MESLTVDPEAIKRLNTQVEAIKSQAISRREQILNNTARRFSDKQALDDKPPFVCEKCGETHEYTVEDRGFMVFYQREACACEREEEERKQVELEKSRVDNEKRRHAAAVHARARSSRIVGKLQNMTFDSFNCTPATKSAFDAAKAVVTEYPNKSLILSGLYGCGKTHLAIAAGTELIKREVHVEFWPGFDLLDKIRKSYNSDGDSEDLCERLSNIDFLIYDDLGNERISSDERGDWARERLFKIFYWRDIRNLPTVITTNYSHELVDKIGMATMSRLLGMCGQPVVINAPDYRLRN